MEALAIEVPPSHNRPFSYTNKKAGYWVGFTHEANHPEWSWFEGWIVARQKVLHGFELADGSTALDFRSATARIRPDFASWTFQSGQQLSLHMVDSLDVLIFETTNFTEAPIFRFKRQAFPQKSIEQNTIFYSSAESADHLFGAQALKGELLAAQTDSTQIALSPAAIGLVLAYGNNNSDVKQLLDSSQNMAQAWIQNRQDRMQQLVEERFLMQTNQDSLNKALAWINLTLDQLVTEQQGTGIYAGLPWFNDYWGRDVFISLPGSSFVTGDFHTAKNILTSFAELQDTDPDSPTYGRVPNRARPDELIYNTTDGTPRFVIEAMNYVRYSGDQSIVQDLYPAIKRSIEGSLQNWIDERGFLTHDEADTWMDAKWEGKTPWSPRGNRAVDIQALWIGQLEAGAWFAEAAGQPQQAQEWEQLANRLKREFSQAFVIGGGGYLADHLDPDGAQDRQFRPNQLFALDLLQDEALKARISRMSWARLVYPWGMSSLDAKDPNFHPYHLAPEHYHKDAAYHNGAVWLWLNGIAMQRLIEFDQQEVAYNLFENMNRLALSDQGVGSLPENADAIPRKGKKWAKTTGTFLQAWSNAEHIRVWYTHFIGFQPDALHKKVAFRPRLPEAIDSLQTRLYTGDGWFSLNVTKNQSENQRFEITNHSSSDYLWEVDIASHTTTSIQLPANHKLHIEVSNKSAKWTVYSKNGSVTEELESPYDALKRTQEEEWSYFFEDLGFAPVDTARAYRVLGGK